jgi:hypothetical protein
MIPIKTLSLLAYFTYISIDIALYASESTAWSFGIFCMMGQVISDPSLGHPSPCGVVPRVPILNSSPPSAWQVSRCRVILIFLVRDEFVEYLIQESSTLG